MAIFEGTIADELKMPVGLMLVAPDIVRPIDASDAVGAATTVAWHRISKPVSTDALSVACAMATHSTYQPTVQELIRFIEAVSAGELVSAADTIGIAPSASVAQAAAVLEALGLLDVALGSASMRMTVAERVQILDTLLRFFAADVSETVGILPEWVPTKLAIAQASAGVGVNAAVSRTLVVRITAPEGINIDDLTPTQMFFSPTLADMVEVAAAYIAPDDIFTVWNVNAITGSVSRYDNYTFNSFARFGQMYIGADENGLYELNGCNDEGTAIIARIKSGLAQLTASRFTMIRDAYVGMRSNGTFVLRITTGEGESYDYTFDTESMKTTRVPMGKGMRTRYVSFELISTGADFDLESVEFIPLMSSRRV